MVVIPLGNVIAVKFSQPLNAVSPIEVMVLGIVIVVTCWQLIKALFPILVTL